MALICPECFVGKHKNCDGTAAIDMHGNVLDCQCDEGDHPLR